MPTSAATRLVAPLRRRAGTTLRARVAGDQANARAAAIWGRSGPRWFTPDDPIWRVHADAAMFPGGVRSLLLQSLHPLAMAGVDDHSDYRSEPWVRVANTSRFLAATTFGTIESATEAIDVVRAIHHRVHGVAPDGRPYDATDPHLLRWVHVAEIETFLASYQAYAAEPLTPAEADTYVEQTAVVARRLGVVDPPLTVRELNDSIDAFRPELRLTPGAARVATFLMRDISLPAAERLGYRLITLAAVATLPQWAREMLGLPRSPRLAAAVRSVVGRPTTALVRWVLTDPSVTADHVIGHADRPDRQ